MFDDPKIRRRAEAEWDTLATEVDVLPAFDRAFGTVRQFYAALGIGG